MVAQEGRRRAAALGCTVLLALVVAGAPSPARAAVAGPFVTLLFSRTEVGGAVGCIEDDRGVARLTTVVAPQLAARGMVATGTLTTGVISESGQVCTSQGTSVLASWSTARDLAARYGWTFVSHTATYPADLSSLTDAQAAEQTCASARAIDLHGLKGGHGMIAYPGAQPSPTDLQTRFGARCFAWGRRYDPTGVTLRSAVAPPFWQQTTAVNGGACNVPTAACASVVSTGSRRYHLPGTYAAALRGLRPDQWLTLQAYVLVTGTSPPGSPLRWDCTSADPRLHWSDNNERYCYRDYRAILDAVAAVPGVRVTDPLSVGVAFGRPATYP